MNLADFAQVPRVKAKFTEAQRSQWLRHLVQLQRNVDEEGGKYTEAMAEVYLPPSESTL